MLTVIYIYILFFNTTKVSVINKTTKVSIINLPCIVNNIFMLFTGFVFIWHKYSPLSLTRTFRMWRFQSFVYGLSTLIRGSLMILFSATVNNFFLGSTHATYKEHNTGQRTFYYVSYTKTSKVKFIPHYNQPPITLNHTQQ